MLLATKPVLDKPVIGYDLDKGALWHHGLLVANISTRIALMKKRKDIADVVFTGGIIHNVGKVVVALYVKSAFQQIMNAVETKGMVFTDAEKEIMGYNHQEVGEIILKKWKFPPVLQAIVRYYAEPDKAPPEFLYEVSIIHIANVLALMAGVGVGNDGLFHEMNQKAIDTVTLTDDEMNDIFNKIPELIKQMREFH